MDEKLLRFFKLVNFNDVIAFENATLKDMIVNRKENTWTLRITAKEIISVKAMINLTKLCADGVDDVKKIFIQMYYENMAPVDILEYFLYFIDTIIENNPSLSGLNKDSIRIDDDIIIIEVLSKIEETVLKKECKKIMKKMADLGITGFDVSFVINEEEVKQVRETIEKEKENVKIPRVIVNDEKPKWTPKKKVDYQREGIVPISSIDRDENAVNLEAYIFDTEFNQLTKKDGTPLFLVTLKISDNTSSILAKTFARDEEEFNTYGKDLKPGKWFSFTGQVRFDDYAKDLVYQFRTYEEIDNPEIKRKDTAAKKELNYIVIQ